MSDLRDNLESAKQKYRAQRYAGDLASELLGATGSANDGTARPRLEREPRLRLTGERARGRGRVLRIGGLAAFAGAVAAAVVVWVVGRPAVVPTNPRPAPQVATVNPPDPVHATTVAVVDPEPELDEPADGETVAEMPALPSFPSDVSLVPPAMSLTETPATERDSLWSIPSPELNFSETQAEESA